MCSVWIESRGRLPIRPSACPRGIGGHVSLAASSSPARPRPGRMDGHGRTNGWRAGNEAPQDSSQIMGSLDCARVEDCETERNEREIRSALNDGGAIDSNKERTTRYRGCRRSRQPSPPFRTPLSPLSLSSLFCRRTRTYDRGGERGRYVELAFSGKALARFVRDGGSAAERPAGRSVAAVAGVGEGGRAGLSLARPAAAAWLSLPSLSTTTSGNSLSEKETHFSRTCEFKCRPGRFLCLWVQRLRWTEQTA